MSIPPLGPRRPVLGHAHSPQEDLKVQVQMLAQIQQQMSQNPRNDEMLFKLREEFHDVISRMDQYIRNLPPSGQSAFAMHLENLKTQLNSYFYELQKGSSIDQIQQAQAALEATSANLLVDLGFKPPSK